MLYSDYQGVRIPLTNSCIQCKMAYAEADDFICAHCAKDMSQGEWNSLRLATLDDRSIPNNEPNMIVKPL